MNKKKLVMSHIIDTDLYFKGTVIYILNNSIYYYF